MRMSHTYWRAFLLLAVAIAAEEARCQRITWLELNGFGYPYSVSNTGIVVGFSETSILGIYWDPNIGLRPFSTVANINQEAVALDVTPDGNAFTGVLLLDSTRGVAFRWIRGNPVEILGSLGSGNAAGFCISDDNTLVAGEGGSISVSNCSASPLGFWWRSTDGMQPLPFDDARFCGSIALDTSESGSIIVGGQSIGGDNFVAAYWENGSLREIGTFGGSQSIARDTDRLGQVIVGSSQESDGKWKAFYWQAGQMNRLSTPIGYESDAFAVDHSGRVIVGAVGTDNRFQSARAVRWVDNRLEDLNDIFACNLQGGETLHVATTISANGRYIAGVGSRNGTFDVFVIDDICYPHNGDVNCDRCVDDADLLAVLFAFGNSGQRLGRVDVNCDDIVDDADLLIVLFNFGSGSCR